MKKFKIKNAVLRWLAGFGILLLGLTGAILVVWKMCRLLGLLTLSFWENHDIVSSGNTTAAGTLTILSLIVGILCLLTIYNGSKALGNCLFNHEGKKSATA